MSPQYPHRRRSLPSRALALLLWPIAPILAGCTNPDDLQPGALAAQGKAAPWQAAVAATAGASRRLSDGEGETVVANAVAAHEQRRP